MTFLMDATLLAIEDPAKKTLQCSRPPRVDSVGFLQLPLLPLSFLSLECLSVLATCRNAPRCSRLHFGLPAATGSCQRGVSFEAKRLIAWDWAGGRQLRYLLLFRMSLTSSMESLRPSTTPPIGAFPGPYFRALRSASGP